MTPSKPVPTDPSLLNQSDQGAEPAWTVAVDELPGSQDWLCEIESPAVYLTFRVSDLSSLKRAVNLLNSALFIRSSDRKPAFDPDRDEVLFGYFGEDVVRLLRDNEDFARCFLVIRQPTGSALRVSLGEGDIRALGGAINQAILDLS